MSRRGKSGYSTVRPISVVQRPTATGYVMKQAETPEQMMEKLILEAFKEEKMETIMELMNVKNKDGVMVFERADKVAIYSIINTAKNIGLRSTIEWLKITLSTDSLIWTSPTLKTSLEYSVNEKLSHQATEEGIKGIGVCSACNNDKLIQSSVQIRSLDEPMTNFIRCPQCNKTWKS